MSFLPVFPGTVVPGESQRPRKKPTDPDAARLEADTSFPSSNRATSLQWTPGASRVSEPSWRPSAARPSIQVAVASVGICLHLHEDPEQEPPT